MASSLNNLTPMEAAQVADAVYNIRLSDDAPKAFKNTILRDKFIFNSDSRFTGKSGIFRSESGFGVLAQGTGKRQGDVLIVTRGTVTGGDWFNNALAVSSMSSNNKVVHKGFNQIFLSFQTDLASQLMAMNPSRVHCVGHSLGGALANLIAEWVETKNIAQSHLYTFGSPRVGKNGFSESLTSSLGAERINRAYHKTDVVPMVPVWPFIHAPEPGLSCYINSPGDYPGAEYHDRKHYISSMRGHNDWSTLRRRHPKINLEKDVENWLESDSPLSLTGNTISMINSAIVYVIKKLALAGLQCVIGEAVNIVDVLARFLATSYHVTKEATSLIGHLMRRILRAIGQVETKIKNVTYQFVRWLLESLALAVFKAAKNAIGLTHRYL